jgi:ribosome-binding factor A
MARGFRRERLEREIFRQVTLILRREMQDPRLSHVTLTRVELADDFSLARLLMSDLEPERSGERQLTLLNRARRFVRTRLSRELGIRRVPELRFDRDKGPANVEAVERFFRGSVALRESPAEAEAAEREEEGTA